MLFNAHLVDFHSQPKGQRDHRVLYIERDPKGKKGQIYHVTGFSVGSPMDYETKVLAPTKSFTFKKIVQIDTIDSKNLARVEDICKAEPAPYAPRKMPKRVRRPDCVDWIENVIFRLHHAEIAQFDRKFVPDQQKQL